ncbi:MAG TPA: hypothetical protein VG796_07070 [Verrucomicrobiales bacterium]|nr:hypothetical protein [Verrucomicrobiales bacterium]
MSQPIRRIIQKTGTSCGVACVAMLARLSYRDAFRTGILCFEASHWSSSHRTDSSELRKMLNSLGWKLGRRVSCRAWRKVPPGSLVAVHLKKDDGWHWVVSDADDDGPFFYDPKRSIRINRRRDFSRVRVAWYHSVTGLRTAGS